MSDLSYLEELSNKELHKQCRDLGLPNIPVTDSSRRVIIRRLRATILGTPLNQKSKTTSRRETVHSSKMTPASVTANIHRTADKESNRRSRRTVSNISSYDSDTSRPKTETTTTVSDIGSQSEEDDDFYTVNSPGVKYSNANQTVSQQSDPRQRRSVSLTKSGVLTTSYTREVEPLHQNFNDDPQSYTYERPRAAPEQKLPSYDFNIERTFAPTYSSSPPITAPRLTQIQLNSTSYTDKIGENIRHTPRHTYIGSTAPFTAEGAPTSSLKHRPTTGYSGMPHGRLIQPTTTVNSLYPQLNEFYDIRSTKNARPADTDSDSDAFDTEVQQATSSMVDTPYKSTFAHNLNAAKHVPLVRPSRPVMRRSTIEEHTESPMHKFCVVVSSLDRKYHLKRYFLLLLVVMLLTFLYVLLSPAT